MTEPKEDEVKKSPTLVGGLEIMGKGPSYQELIDKWGNMDLPLWKRNALKEAKQREVDAKEPKSEPSEAPMPMMEEKKEDKPEPTVAKDSFAGSSIRRIAALSEETRKRVQ